jgi:hypothetical protein
MITLLSMLGSGLLSIFPGIFTILGRWFDDRKEIQLAQINADLQKTSMENGKVMATLGAETAEIATLHAEESISVSPFWDGVRASIRPVITYLFVGLFVAAKILVFWHLVWTRNTDIVIAVNQVWDEPTSAITAGIIAFWFGSRAVDKSVVVGGKGKTAKA